MDDRPYYLNRRDLIDLTEFLKEFDYNIKDFWNESLIRTKDSGEVGRILRLYPPERSFHYRILSSNEDLDYILVGYLFGDLTMGTIDNLVAID